MEYFTGYYFMNIVLVTIWGSFQMNRYGPSKGMCIWNDPPVMSYRKLADRSSLSSCSALSGLVWSGLFLSGLVWSSLVLSCLVMSCPVLLCLVLSCVAILGCLVLSCRVLSCLVRCCDVLCSLVLSWLFFCWYLLATLFCEYVIGYNFWNNVSVDLDEKSNLHVSEIHQQLRV